MKKMALKVRIYPTQEQCILINKTFGCCRQIYNLLLADRIEYYNNNIKGKELSKTQRLDLYKSYKPLTEKQIKEIYPYMTEVSSVALQQSRRDMEGAFIKFFRGKTKFPKFHSKKENCFSYRENNGIRFNWYERTIRLPKIQEVKFRLRSLPNWYTFNCKLCNVTVSKSRSEQYYASMIFEIEELPKLKSENQTIGLDFSLSNMYVDSNGLSGRDFGYIPQKQNHLRQLNKLKRKFARKKKGSLNREKARIKLARMEQHIANSRKNWIEKETLRLVRDNNIIGVESLKLENMIKFSRNSKNYVDTSWGYFVTRLSDKAERYSCNVVKSDTFFASSKICHICGYKKTDLKLYMRHWTCPVCNTEHDRDVNAAINLKNNAIKILREAEEFRSAEGVEELASLALAQFGASVETERKTS